MTTESKDHLLRTGDDSKAACGRRVKIAIEYSGKSQKEIGSIIGRTESSMSGQVSGAQFPSRELMRYFLKSHRIDYNYFHMGLYNQLPGDVQEKLVASANAVDSTSAKKTNSD